MKRSFGILPYKVEEGLKLYLVHMGGPYWKKRKRSWSIVKGEPEEGEEPLSAAVREFFEETGQKIEGNFIPLGTVKTPFKTVTVWAVEAEPDTKISSNSFTIEWPPHSGIKKEFPEVDRAGWFSPEDAEKIVVKSQIPIIERVKNLLQKN
ncbi:MutT-like protein [Hydrogenimonas sp.]|nr:MutT-like protein [Hydrogenimonas sp.]